MFERKVCKNDIKLWTSCTKLEKIESTEVELLILLLIFEKGLQFSKKDEGSTLKTVRV